MSIALSLSGISSMATRRVLAELAQEWRTRSGVEVVFESVGGVDAAQRIAGGEAFDLAVLDADALDRLADGEFILYDSQTPLIRSEVMIAVRAGAPHPQVSSEEALKQAVLAAPSIGRSTGPSGRALLALFERWGVRDALRDRIVEATPGVPVARLVAEGRVALGFQQRSEMLDEAGIEIVGPLPPGCEIVSVFSAGVCEAARQPEAARAFIEFMHSPDAAQAKRRHGMAPA